MMTDTMVSAAHLSPVSQLGVRLEGTFTAEEAMEKGRLAGWNVRKWPAYAVDPDTGRKIPKDGMYDVVRDDPDTGKPGVLSRYNVGESYQALQNEQHAEFLNTLVDESGANFELAGSTDNGRRVFISMRLPGHIHVGGVDPIDTSLLAINSHDGSMAFTLAALPVRYACANVCNLTWGRTSNLIRIRHTSGAHSNMVTRAREALDINFRYLDEFQKQAERLIDTALTELQFVEMVEREFGAGDDAAPAAVTRADKKIAQLTELFCDSPTQANVRHTAWGGLNALTEWSDHFSPTRGGDPDTNRAARAVLDPAFKQRALQLMLSV